MRRVCDCAIAAAVCRLQVDRQTKGSYATYEAAEKVGLVIKKEHPILQVAVYDGVESVNKIIELP
jgi:hypothetical protein